jgi:hypothetical protein
MLRAIGDAVRQDERGSGVGEGGRIYPPEYLYGMSGEHGFQEAVNHCGAAVRIFDLRPKTAAVANRATG